MTIRRHLAAIRFGQGLRLGEEAPPDPLAWLDSQLGPEAPLPPSPGVAERIRLREAARQERRARDGMAAATGMEAAAPAPPAADVALMRADVEDWARRRLTGEQPFRERLVDFWMNHFTVSRRNGQAAILVPAFEREAIRPHVTGRFADMLAAAALHPAMLTYLDNAGSIGPNSQAGRRQGRGLNENLAREVLELHSLSPAGGYTQGDVGEFARILTGHSVSARDQDAGPVFRPQTHEPGPKHLLGRTIPEGPEGAAAALRLLAEHPATARHLAVKLVRHFVADDPPPELVRAVEAPLRDGGDLLGATRALIRHPRAWDPPLTKYRSPADHVLAACRALGLEGERAGQVLGGMNALGQPLWSAPQPNGWPETREAWLAPEALMRRLDWNHTIAGRAPRADPAAVAEAALGPLARAETVAEMRRAGSVRDALTLLFSSPEFLHR